MMGEVLSLDAQRRLRAAAGSIMARDPDPDRLHTFLLDGLMNEENENMMNDRQTSIRLPADLLERAEALLPAVAADPAFKYVPRMGGAFVLRLAIEAGLEALEARYPQEPAPTSKRSTKGRSR